MKPTAARGLIVLALGTTGALADEGRIPIFGPTTITQPGSYVVTRGISVASGDALTIATSGVSLDLNGKAIHDDDASAAVIRIGGNVQNLHIRNGQLDGGSYGIAADTVGSNTLWLDDLTITGAASDGVMAPYAGYFEMHRCSFVSLPTNGVNVSGGSPSTPLRGIVENSRFIDVANYGLSVGFAAGFQIRQNIFSNQGGQTITLGSGALLDAGGYVVEGNTLTSSPLSIGSVPTAGIVAVSPGVLITNNLVTGYATGIVLSGGGGRLVGNIVRAGVAVQPGTGNGVYLGGTPGATHVMIEDNEIEGNGGCGIRLFSTATGNAYRNNMLRGNAGGAVCDSGTGNTDAGGNVL
jgi:parallel beta-helix repeat protein